MKDFIKFMFASFLGTLLTLLIVFFIFFGLIAGLVAMAEADEVEVEPNSVLHIKWTTQIKDRGSENPFEGFDFASMTINEPLGLNDILRNLEKAKEDPNIKGILLDMEIIPAGGATVEEIRDKLLEFKESGKFIISYANGYDQKAYYLASLSDEIYLHPEGMMLFKGLNAQLVFLKGMLEKIDVEMQVVRGPDNKYKSDVESLIMDKMSEATREQFDVLLNSIWSRMLLDISQSRGIAIDDLNRIADKLEATMPDKALELNFVDGLLFRDQLNDRLRELTETDKDEDLSVVRFSQYVKAKSPVKAPSTRNRIAIVYAQGIIVQGKGDPNSIGAVTMAKAIRKARESDNVKAIVFRVNSGGGDALASDIVRREVELAAKEKPFIVSMGDLATSGGYLISTDASYIFAQPTTITGSIGVFIVIPNFKGLFNNKLGITFDKVMTNENADFVDVMEPMSDFQYKKINESIDKTYDEFIGRVALARGLDPGFVDGIARGRVWSGVDAKELGLVDELGGLEDAIAYAAEQADLGEKYRIREYPFIKPFFQQMIDELGGQARARIIGNELNEFKSYYDHIQAVREMEGVQARLPYFISIN